MTRMTSFRFRSGLRLGALGLALALAGCGASPEAKRYLLTSAAAPAPAAVASGPRVMVAEATAAPYFDRSQLVSRPDDFRVEWDEFEVWAEPIGRLVTAKLVDDLAARYGRARVMAARTGRALDADFTVGADVLRFDSDAGGAAVVELRWTLASERRGCLVATDRMRVSRAFDASDAADETAPDPRVQAYSEAMEEISARIAEAIEAARTGAACL